MNKKLITIIVVVVVIVLALIMILNSGSTVGTAAPNLPSMVGGC